MWGRGRRWYNCGMITIRDAAIGDAAELLGIYDHYVKDTAVTFEITTPSLAEFEARIEGYCYAHLFVGHGEV